MMVPIGAALALSVAGEGIPSGNAAALGYCYRDGDPSTQTINSNMFSPDFPMIPAGRPVVAGAAVLTTLRDCVPT